MEINLKLQIQNLYGGDGIIRFEDIKTIKLTRTKSRKTTKSSTGVSSENAIGEEQTEIKKEEIQTFKFEEGKPIYRMGGIHGKYWGHLRFTGKMLADLGIDGFNSKAFVDRMMMSINISPVIVRIEKHDEIKQDIIPQILNTIGNSMRFFKYDYIPNCEIELKLTFPDLYKKQVFEILKQSELVGGLNKRRATIKILNKEILK